MNKYTQLRLLVSKKKGRNIPLSRILPVDEGIVVGQKKKLYHTIKVRTEIVDQFLDKKRLLLKNYLLGKRIII